MFISYGMALDSDFIAAAKAVGLVTARLRRERLRAEG